MAKTNFTAERLRELFQYEPDTGHFIRLKSTSGNAKVGDVAGGGNGRGYVKIHIDGKLYFAHRLVWLYTYGEWPSKNIDHIDGDHSNNRLSNLRDISQAENVQNRRSACSASTLGFLGVGRNGNYYMATIQVDKRRIHLGTFPTPEIAHEAYLSAKRKLHPACTI